MDSVEWRPPFSPFSSAAGGEQPVEGRADAQDAGAPQNCKPLYSCPIQIPPLQGTTVTVCDVCTNKTLLLHCSRGFPFDYNFLIMRYDAMLLTAFLCAQTRGRKPQTQTKLLLVGSIRIAPSTPIQTPSLVLRLGTQRPSNGELGSPCCRMPWGTSTSRLPSLMEFPGYYQGTRAPLIVLSHRSYLLRHLVPSHRLGAFQFQPLL